MGGPGQTTYQTRDDGTVVKVCWGDPAWTTIHLHAEDTRTPAKIAQLLREAYQEGFADRATHIQNALGIQP